jgi:uncharacterized protein (TIGR02145 family)
MQYTTQEGTQGICPYGWHLPSDAEWTILTNYVSSQAGYWCDSISTYIAKSLASMYNWNLSTTLCDVGNDPGSNDATGFSGLSGGLRYCYGSFDSYWHLCFWWTSTEYDSSDAWSRFLAYDLPEVYRLHNYEKCFGFSVRCLLDD